LPGQDGGVQLVREMRWVDERQCVAPGSRLLLTAAGPTMARVLHELSLPTFAAFAEAWGYSVRAVDLPRDGAGADAAAQTAKWAKLHLLREAIDQYETVLWMDADVLIMRTDEDVADHLRPGDFQALALEQVPAEHRLNPNTGVWLLTGSTGRQFLDDVIRIGPRPGPWADQAAVLAALGWDLGDDRHHGARPGLGNSFLVGTSWLPVSWNQPFTEGRLPRDCFNSDAASYEGRPTVPAPHALHFMGLTPEARLRHMKSLAAQPPGAETSRILTEPGRRPAAPSGAAERKVPAIPAGRPASRQHLRPLRLDR
jgi:hypothetical protein